MYRHGLSCVLFLLVSSLSSLSAWVHLELGAGNYGQDGHTKASQAMTVLMKFKEVTSARNYIDDLEEVGRGDYKPEEQYRVLFWTLDELVRRYGEVGTFYVNDLYEEYATFATQKLVEYAKSKGYDSIVIEAMPGDYEQMDCNNVKYSTVHLKNPDVSFYNNRMDGDDFYSTEQSREETRVMLQNLANLSETGLFLFILDMKDDYIPPEEKIEFIRKRIFYHRTKEWEAVPYIFPEGTVIHKDVGAVFHIIPNR